MSSLKPYLSNLVLVGGWTPYLYSKYLWKNISILPVSTLDIDMGIEELSMPWNNKTIFNLFKKLDYGFEPIYDKEKIPVIPVFIDKEKKLKIRIEFITSFYVSDDTINRFLGKEIAVHRIDEFEWLLKDILELEIPYRGEIIKLNLPQPHTFIFHKGLTFPMREDDLKQAKDLYYLYYVLRFYPEYTKLVNKITLLKKEDVFNIFIKNLMDYFGSETSKGPLMVESVSGFDPYIPSIRKDAYQRIQRFVVDLG